MSNSNKILIEVSNKHIHLSQKDIDILFWENYELNNIKNLSQPWQFAAAEQVSIVNWEREINKIRVLWPARPSTQLEISQTDAYFLKINSPVRESWDIKWTPWLKLVWPKGDVVLEKWVIIAKRHLHLSDIEANELNLKDKQLISLEISGEKWWILNNIVVRVNPNYKEAIHIDTDEWNAFWIKGEVYWKIIK